MTKRNEKVPELSHIAEGAAQRTLEGKHPMWWELTPQERLDKVHEAKKFLENRREETNKTIADKVKDTLKRFL